MEILSSMAPVGTLFCTVHPEYEAGISLPIKGIRWIKLVSVDAPSSNRGLSMYYVRSWTERVDRMHISSRSFSKLNLSYPFHSKTRSFALNVALEEGTLGNDRAEKEEGKIEIEEGTGEANFGLSVVADMKSVIKPSRPHRNRVTELCRSLWPCKTTHDVDEVLSKFQELPPLPVYSIVIKSFGINNQLDAAFALVEWLKMKKNSGHDSMSPNLFIYHSLLGAVKRATRFEDVDRVLADMADQGLHPCVTTYNILMSIQIDQGKPSEAFQLLSTIEEQGLHPDPVTYSTLLVAYWRLGDVSGALQFYDDLRDRYTKGQIGCSADENFDKWFVRIKDYTLRICFQLIRQRLLQEDNSSVTVMRILAQMDKAQLPLGGKRCEKLIWACTVEGHYPVARELYRRLREMDNGISLAVCNHVIWLMGKAKRWWAALEVYEDLLDKGPTPNVLSYELIMSHFNLLLTAARKKGNWKWAIHLVDKMEEKGLKPGCKQWDAVLVACSKASEASSAIQIFKRMIDRGQKPTILSYGALLSALEKGKLYDEALRVWEHMRKVGVQPNVFAYTTLISIYFGKGEILQVDVIVQEMVSSGIEPTIVTYNAIISGCARQNLGSAALEWFHHMQEKNICPNKITYEMLVKALAEDGKTKLAYDVYLQASNAGLHLSSKAYNALVNSCQVYDTTVDLDAVGLESPAKRKPVRTVPEFCNVVPAPR